LRFSGSCDPIIYAILKRETGFQKNTLPSRTWEREMGFLLICIGAQFAINGVRELMLDVDFWQQ
jgi:hypothetical protein